METIERFIAKHNIKMSCNSTDKNPNMAEWRDATHWLCLFTRPGTHKRMKVYFSQGLAHTEEPDTKNVLDCLASDARGVYIALGTNGQLMFISFESWCRDYGYDTDSRKAERTYKAICRQAESMHRFLGTGYFFELLNDVEAL